MTDNEKGPASGRASYSDFDGAEDHQIAQNPRGATIAHPLASMIAEPYWLLWKLVPDHPKPRKVPISALTLVACDPTDKANLTDYATAHAVAQASGYGLGYSLGFCGHWCVDLDNCIIDGGYNAVATDAFNRFPGAAMEISQSGKGAHIFGRGAVPPHANKNVALSIELYTDKRYIAVTFTNAIGNSDTRHDAAMAQFVADYFIKTSSNSEASGWTDTPGEGYDYTLADDDKMLERAFLAHERGVYSRFPGADKATLRQLFTGDEEALATAFPSSTGDVFDRSSADASLAGLLLWWTGQDCERVRRLMYRSALKRDKWDNRPDYLEETILGHPAFVPGNFAKPMTGNGDVAGTGTGAEGETKPNRVIVTLARQGVTSRYDMRRRVYELCLPESMLWKGRMVGCLPIDDDAIRQICRMVAPYVKASMADVEQAIKTMGGLDKFDPAFDYFESLQWDGTARLDVLLPYYCGTEDTPLNRGYGRHFMLGAVARTYWPGCSHDEVLALIGQQGVGKSHFTKILGGDWHSDAPLLGLDTQKVIERVGNSLIHEIAEIRLTGRDGEQVKAFLSTTHHTARAAFGRVPETVPARWVHVSTGNDDKFLTDMTGNRRWHVVAVTNIRLEELRIARDQLWAEAVAIFKSRYPNWRSVATQDRRIHFSHELWSAQAQAAEAARLRDPWEDMIPETIGTGRIALQPSNSKTASVGSYFVSTGSILQALNARGSVQDTKRVASVCVQLGWIPHKQRFNGQILRGYLIPGVLVPST